MKLEFRMNDFASVDDLTEGQAAYITLLADAKLEKYIQNHGKVIYSGLCDTWGSSKYSEIDNIALGAKFKAILINIEPLKKEHIHKFKGSEMIPQRTYAI